MSSKFRYGGRPQQSQAVCNINTPIPDFGGIYISDTAVYPTGTTDPSPTSGYCAFYTLTATVFNAATKCNITNLPGASIPAGVWIYGIFSTIKLTSGSGIAYNTTD